MAFNFPSTHSDNPNDENYRSFVMNNPPHYEYPHLGLACGLGEGMLENRNHIWRISAIRTPDPVPSISSLPDPVQQPDATRLKLKWAGIASLVTAFVAAALGVSLFMAGVGTISHVGGILIGSSILFLTLGTILLIAMKCRPAAQNTNTVQDTYTTQDRNTDNGNIQPIIEEEPTVE